MTQVLFLAAVVAIQQADVNPHQEAIERYVRENANDAEKVEFVTFSKPFRLKGCREWIDGAYPEDTRGVLELWATFKGDNEGVGVKYRIPNAFGAKIIREDVFVMKKDGTVARVIDGKNIKVPALK